MRPDVSFPQEQVLKYNSHECVWVPDRLCYLNSFLPPSYSFSFSLDFSKNPILCRLALELPVTLLLGESHYWVSGCSMSF